MNDPVRLLQLTDTHLFADPSRSLRDVVTRDSLRAVLDAARRQPEWPPAAILATGDLSEDESRGAYQAFADMLAPFELPVHCLPGNHDDPACMRGLLDRPPFTLCATPRLGRWQLVMLSSRLPRTPAGKLGEAELARLDRALSAGGYEHALVCVHHQPLPMGSRWVDRHMLADANDFRRLITSHPRVRAVLWGHVHQQSDRDIDGVRWLSTPATCGQFLPGSDEFATDDRPPAWRWLTLHPDGRIDTEVSWLTGGNPNPCATVGE